MDELKKPHWGIKVDFANQGFDWSIFLTKLFYGLLIGVCVWGGIMLSFFFAVPGILFFLAGIGILLEYYFVVVPGFKRRRV